MFIVFMGFKPAIEFKLYKKFARTLTSAHRSCRTVLQWSRAKKMPSVWPKRILALKLL